jgi:predicted PurR-regulated permease PerM
LGAKLGGVLGLLVAIPTASFIKDITDTWRAGELNQIDNTESDSAKVEGEVVVTHS